VIENELEITATDATMRPVWDAAAGSQSVIALRAARWDSWSRTTSSATGSCAVEPHVQTQHALYSR